MAVCPKCRKPCPDTALHCGYCGAALAQPAPVKKTLFGFAPAQQPAPPQPAARPAPIPAPTRPAEPATDSDGTAKTQIALEAPAPIAPRARASARPQPAAEPDPLASLPAPASLRRSQSHPQQERPTQADAPIAATMAADAIQATMYAPASAAPQPAIPATMYAPSPAAAPGAIPATMYAVQTDAAPPRADSIPATVMTDAAQPAPTATPIDAGAVTMYGAPAAATERAARGDLSRPVLASETLAEDAAPLEPGRGLLRALMIVGGLLLVGLFCAPWGAVGDKLIFSWDTLKHLGSLQFVGQIYLVAAGTVLVIAGLLPLPYLLRALIATTIGLVPLVVTALQVEEWRAITTLGGIVLLSAALYHRARYRDSILARALVGAGVVALLCTLFIPSAKGVPLVLAFEGLAGASGREIVVRLYPLLLLVLCLLSLLAYLGKASTALGGVWATAILFYLPVRGWVLGLFELDRGPALQHLSKLYDPLVLLIALALAAIGLSQVLAKAVRRG